MFANFFNSDDIDACQAERLFQVLPSSISFQQMFPEMLRVTKPGGWVVHQVSKTIETSSTESSLVEDVLLRLLGTLLCVWGARLLGDMKNLGFQVLTPRRVVSCLAYLTIGEESLLTACF